jgi:hypothetical protein
VTAAVKVTQHDDRLWREIQANGGQIDSQGDGPCFRYVAAG